MLAQGEYIFLGFPILVKKGIAKGA